MTSERTIKVLVVEDFPLNRFGIVSMLEQDPMLTVVGDAASAEAGLEEIDKTRPDIVMMDLGLPGMDGIEATQRIKQAYPDMKVIVMTSHDAKDDVLASLSAGANAYCLKHIASEKLPEVIKSVHHGAIWLDPGIAKIAMDFFSSAEESPVAANNQLQSLLSPREYEILKLIVKGKNNTDIAHELNVSVHTVKFYVSSVLDKLMVSDRVQAAVRAVKAGLS